MARNLVARLLLVVPLLAAGIALGAPSPAAAAITCVNQTGGTIKGNIVVLGTAPHCTLVNVSVRGSVTVEPGAFFIATGSEIRGSVTAVNSVGFSISSSEVRGPVEVTGGSFVEVQRSVVRGDLVARDVISSGLRIAYNLNTVRGSLILTGNGPLFPVVGGNVIDGDLICEGNTEAPQLGFGYPPPVVGGVATGQCETLVAP